MAAPTASLYIPTPSASRMSPCPVFACVDLGRRNWRISGGSNSTTWTNSSGSEYVLDQALSTFMLAGTGTPTNITVKQKPESPGDDSFYTAGTVGSLAAGEYGTSAGSLYIRLDDDTDPDSKDANFLQLGFDVSDSGDSKSWALCNVFWELEYDGAALTNWPDQYRYTTDPRPRLNNRQIDLSGLDQSDYNRPCGYNMGWVLTAGTWRIKATIINASGEATVVTSSDIVIAADTRTEYTVNSAGGADYTSIAAALSAQAANSNILITVEGGHTENIGTAGWYSAITGDNFVIAWDGVGARPVVTYNGSASGTGGSLFSSVGTEHTVVYGIDFIDSSGGAAAETIGITMLNFGAYAAGVSVTGDSVTSGVKDNSEGLLIINCTTGDTANYSFISDGAGYGGQEQGVFIGNNWGPSGAESCHRVSTSEQYHNVLWQTTEENASTGVSPNRKNSYRFAGCSFVNRWGCYAIDGISYFGRVNQASGPSTYIGRVEGEYCGLKGHAQFTDDAFECLWANGVFTDEMSNPAAIIRSNESDRTQDCYILHNTATGSNIHFNWAPDDDTDFSNNRAAANAFIRFGDGGTGLGTIEDGALTVANNDFDYDSTTSNFLRIDVAGVFDHYDDNVTELNAETWASGNTAGVFTLDQDYIPSSPTSVATEEGVVRDYFGTARPATSWAGAVGRHPDLSYNSLSADANLQSHLELQDNAASTAVVDEITTNGVLVGGDNTADITTTGPGGDLAAALQLDGSADYITTSGPTIAADTVGSIFVWAKRDATTTIDTMFGSQSNNSRYFQFDGDGTNLRLREGGTAVTQAHGVTTTGWHSYGAVKRADTLWDIYVDGALVQADSGGDNLAFAVDLLGAKNSSGTAEGYFDGALARAMVFDRELSEAEFAELHGGKEPLNTVAPTISGDTAIGSTLTCTTGTWNTQSNGTLTYAYQWLRGGIDISGATSSTWVSTGSADDVITCRVAASNDGGNDANEDTVSSNSITLTSAGGGTNRNLLLLGVG